MTVWKYFGFHSPTYYNSSRLLRSKMESAQLKVCLPHKIRNCLQALVWLIPVLLDHVIWFQSEVKAMMSTRLRAPFLTLRERTHTLTLWERERERPATEMHNNTTTHKANQRIYCAHVCAFMLMPVKLSEIASVESWGKLVWSYNLKGLMPFRGGYFYTFN